MADAIGRHPRQAFEQCDAPGGEGGEVSGLGRQVLEMCVPGEAHENSGQCWQQAGLQDQRDVEGQE